MDTLISTGTPKLRFPGFHDQWQQKRLGEIGKIISGLTYSPSDVCNTGTLVLRSSNVQNRRLTFEDNVHVNTDKGSFNPVRENDILICVRNGSRGLIGKNAIVEKKYAGLAFGAFMAVYRSENNRFIFHLLDTSKFKKEVHKNLGATINSINGSDLKKFKFSFPTTEEQELIACSLSLVDTWLDNLISQKENLELYKKGIMQKIFSQGVRFKSIEGKDYPVWQEIKLGDIFKESSERKGEQELELLSVTTNNGITKQTSSNKRDNSSKNKSNYKVVHKTDVAYNTMRMWQGSFCVSEYDGFVSPAYTVVRLLSGIAPFFKYLLKQPRVIFDFYRYSQGLTSDTWNLKFNNFSKVIVCVPSDHEEQQKIADLLTSIDRIIESKQSQISKVENWKSGLLQQMFI